MECTRTYRFKTLAAFADKFYVRFTHELLAIQIGSVCNLLMYAKGFRLMKAQTSHPWEAPVSSEKVTSVTYKESLQWGVLLTCECMFLDLWGARTAPQAQHH